MAEPNILSGLAQANFYGQEADSPERKNLLDALEAGQQALETRYANPNWFNIAAGFAKPQLGGFTASLGSANEAMGANEEKRRQDVLTASQYRAQVALMKNQMAQSQTAADKAKGLANKPGGLVPGDISEVSNYDKGRGDILQKELDNQIALRKEIMEQHASGRSDAELAAQYGPKFAQLFPQGTPTLAQVPGATAQKQGASTPSTPPMESGLTQQYWDNLPLARQNEIVQALAGSNQENVLNAEKALREPAQSAPQEVARLKTMRELATMPGMHDVFAVLKGSDIASLTGKALSEGRLTERLSDLEPILRQANIKDPKVLRNVSELAKLINEQKLASGSNGVATDQLRAMQAEGNPAFDNPQDAFVTLADAIAHTRGHQFKLWNTVSGNTPEGKRHNAYTFVGSEDWKPLNSSYVERHSKLFSNPPSPDVPSDIYDLAPATKNAAPEVVKTTPGTTAPAAKTRTTPAGWVKQPNGSFKKVE